MQQFKKPSITELIKLLDKPALLKWANSLGLSGKSLDDHRNSLADKGTSIHLQIERYVNLKEPFEDPAVNAAFEKFISDKEILEVEKNIDTEWFVGRMDIKIRHNNKIYVCDFKSNKGIFFENYLQLSAYRMAEDAQRIAIIELPSFEFKDMPVVDFGPFERIIKALSFIYTTKKQLGF